MNLCMFYHNDVQYIGGNDHVLLATASADGDWPNLGMSDPFTGDQGHASKERECSSHRTHRNGRHVDAYMR